MIFDAEQRFTLPYPGPPEAALAFLRDPAHSLRALTFLHDLRLDGGQVGAVMLVPVPLLGEIRLPFRSEVLDTPTGARLEPWPLQGERAWVEVSGDGEVTGEGGMVQLHYALRFRAHVALPAAEKWGGAAFERMAQQAARHTLERLAREFPAGVQAAMP